MTPEAAPAVPPLCDTCESLARACNQLENDREYNAELVRERDAKLKEAESQRSILLDQLRALRQEIAKEIQCWPPFGEGAAAIRALKKFLPKLDAVILSASQKEPR